MDSHLWWLQECWEMTEKTVRKNYADHDDDAIAKAFNEEMAKFIKKQKEKDDDSEGEVAV